MAVYRDGSIITYDNGSYPVSLNSPKFKRLFKEVAPGVYVSRKGTVRVTYFDGVMTLPIKVTTIIIKP